MRGCPGVHRRGGVPLQQGKTVRSLTAPTEGGTAVSATPATHIFSVAIWLIVLGRGGHAGRPGGPQ
jgi:hypothetical protein